MLMDNWGGVGANKRQNCTLMNFGLSKVYAIKYSYC